MFQFKYISDRNNMKKTILAICFATSLAISACGSGSREETDDQDSIDAARSADSMLQNQLNADTTMNTDGSMDNMPTDSMRDHSQTH